MIRRAAFIIAALALAAGSRDPAYAGRATLVAGSKDPAYAGRNHAGRTTVVGRVFRPGSDSITPETARLLRSWVEAVHSHVPGRGDGDVESVARLTYQDRFEMNAGIDLFFAALEQRKVSTGGNKAAESVVSLAHGAGMDERERVL